MLLDIHHLDNPILRRPFPIPPTPRLPAQTPQLVVLARAPQLRVRGVPMLTLLEGHGVRLPPRLPRPAAARHAREDGQET